MRIFTAIAAILIGGITSSLLAQQQQVRVTIENLQPSNGFFLTPVFTAFHNGTFDFFNSGSAASGALELMAEEGDLSGLNGVFDAFGNGGQRGVIFGPAGFPGAPVIDSGEIASALFTINTSNRYLSYGTMIIPSNDGFFGNDNPTAIEVFDAAGNFVFSGSRTFTFAELWDAGTEANLADGSVNNGNGAAFAAVNGGFGQGTPTPAGTISLFSTQAGSNALSNLTGLQTAAGTTIDFGSASNSPVFRLTVTAVPEPGSLVLFGVAGTIATLCRRREKVHV